MKLLKSLLIGAAVFTATPALAQMSTYTISNGQFSDGTSFGGTFQFDPTSKQFGTYSVTTLAGTLSGQTYDNANSGSFNGGWGPNSLYFFLDNGSRYFNFSFNSALGTGTQAFNYASSWECNNCGTWRNITGGSVSNLASISAVPEPDTWAMFILGFGAIGGTMRYRKRKSSLAHVAA